MAFAPLPALRVVDVTTSVAGPVGSQSSIGLLILNFARVDAVFDERVELEVAVPLTPRTVWTVTTVQVGDPILEKLLVE